MAAAACVCLPSGMSTPASCNGTCNVGAAVRSQPSRPATIVTVPSQTLADLQLEYVTRRMIECEPRHRRITNRLHEIGPIDYHISSNHDVLYGARGKRTVRQASLGGLTAEAQRAFKAYSAQTRSPAARVLAKVSGARRRKVAHLRAEWNRAHHVENAAKEEIAELDEIIREAELRKVTLDHEKIEHTELNADLEHLYSSIFGDSPSSSASQLWPRQAGVFSVHAVNALTAQLLAAEMAREKRAREFLLKSKAHAQRLTKDLQAALQHCIDTGIATNTKYTRQLFAGNSALGTAKAVTPFLLAAKTSSGKMHEQHAHARVAQPLVRAPPALAVLELHLLPGRGSARALDERGLHASLEKSYAQARQCVAHVLREVERSRARSEGLAQKHKQLKAACELSLEDLRLVRADILERTVRGEPHAAVARDPHSGAQPTPGAVAAAQAVAEAGAAGGDGAPDALAPPPSGLRDDEIDRQARVRLRAMIRSVASRAGAYDPDDELPGYEYIFGAP